MYQYLKNLKPAEDAYLSSSNIDTCLVFAATDYVTDFNNIIKLPILCKIIHRGFFNY
jgi:hypothetical protein